MADLKDNPTRKLAVVFDYSSGKVDAPIIQDRLRASGIPWDSIIYAPVVGLSLEMLAVVRAVHGPGWPLSDDILKDAVVSVPPDLSEIRPEDLPLNVEFLTQYLKRFPPESEGVTTALKDAGIAAIPFAVSPVVEDQVRVLRMIEYTGPRKKIEVQITRSLHGTRDYGNGVQITAVTVGEYPEVLEQAKLTPPATLSPQVPQVPQVPPIAPPLFFGDEDEEAGLGSRITPITVADAYTQGCTCRIGRKADPDCPIHRGLGTSI